MASTMRKATEERLRDLPDLDPALRQLAMTLAIRLDDPDTFTAAAAKEYRLTMTQLTAPAAARAATLDDLDDDE